MWSLLELHLNTWLNSDSSNISINFPTIMPRTWFPIMMPLCPSATFQWTTHTGLPRIKSHRISAKVTRWESANDRTNTWTARTLQYPCPISIYRQGRGTSWTANHLTQRNAVSTASTEFKEYILIKKHSSNYSVDDWQLGNNDYIWASEDYFNFIMLKMSANTDSKTLKVTNQDTNQSKWKAEAEG